MQLAAQRIALNLREAGFNVQVANARRAACRSGTAEACRLRVPTLRRVLESTACAAQGSGDSMTEQTPAASSRRSATFWTIRH